MSDAFDQAIVVRDLRFSYSVAAQSMTALDGVDLDLLQGEIVCLEGLVTRESRRCRPVSPA